MEIQHAGRETCGRTACIGVCFLTGLGEEAFPALTTCINRIYNPRCRHHICLHAGSKKKKMTPRSNNTCEGQTSEMGFMFFTCWCRLFRFQPADRVWESETKLPRDSFSFWTLDEALETQTARVNIYYRPFPFPFNTVISLQPPRLFTRATCPLFYTVA